MPHDQEPSPAADPRASTRPPATPAQGAPPSPAADAGRPGTPIPQWELVVMISGAAVLIGSFLPFISISEGELGPGAPDFSWNAWSNALSLFPVSVLVVLYAVVAAGQLALARFTESTLPDRVAGFSWPELRLLSGMLATLTMVGYFARSWPGGGVDREIGLYVVTLGAIGLLVGAVMERGQSGHSASAEGEAGARQPTQGDIAIMVAGAAILLGSLLTVYTDVAAEGSGTGSAWAEGLFPLFVIPVVLGAAMAAQIALTTFGAARIPDRILGVEWNKVHLAFGVHAALMMLGFLVGTFYFTVLGESIPEPEEGTGFWIMLVGALGLAGGAILRTRESTASPRPAVPGPAPAATAPSSTAPPPRPSERLEGPAFAPPPTADDAGRATEPERATCPHCGSELRPGDRFCPACGRERVG